MMELTVLEHELLDILTDSKEGKFKGLKEHISSIIVHERKFVKNVLCVQFQYMEEKQFLQDEIPLEALLSSEKILRVDGYKSDFGYVLDIENGHMSMMEIYPKIEEKWNGVIDQYEIK